MPKYRLVNVVGQDALEENVNRLLKEGWRLQGGVARNGGVALMQAMVQDDEDTEGEDKNQYLKGKS